MNSPFVSVPVAFDGSIFSPACTRAFGYQIGAKGFEQKYKCFWEALKGLQDGINHWRRPNENNNFGIVVVRFWKEIPRVELEAMFS